MLDEIKREYVKLFDLSGKGRLDKFMFEVCMYGFNNMCDYGRLRRYFLNREKGNVSQNTFYKLVSDCEKEGLVKIVEVYISSWDFAKHNTMLYVNPNYMYKGKTDVYFRLKNCWDRLDNAERQSLDRYMELEEEKLKKVKESFKKYTKNN